MSVTAQSNVWSAWTGATIDGAEPDAPAEAGDCIAPPWPIANSVGLAELAGVRTRWRHWRSTTALSAMAALAVIAVTFVRGPSPQIPAQPARTTSPAAPGTVVIPAQNFDLPDPMMVMAGGKYYTYFSTAFLDASHANVPELVGSPGHWGPEVDALPRLPSWARDAHHGGKVWAPYVLQIHGQWLMYFSASLKRPGRVYHCLGVARGASAAGPFVPVGTQPLECQLPEGGDIDVQPYQDPTGPGGAGHPWYLLWKSDNNSLTPIRPTLIWSAPLSNDGLTVRGRAAVIFAPDESWQLPVLEAPQMVRSPYGGEWLFYSAGKGFFAGRYAIGVAKCSGPMGLCHDLTNVPLVATNAQGAGPGEETVFVGPDHSYWLLYNPWHTGILFGLMRPAEGVRIGWTPEGPYVADAGTFPQPILPVAAPHARFR